MPPKTLQIRNILAEGELNEISVTEDFSVTAADGKNYRTKHYNLGYLIDRKRMENGAFLKEDFNRGEHGVSRRKNDFRI